MTACHWSRNQVSNIPEIIPGASPRGPKRSIGVPGCANGSLFCEGKRPPFSPPSCRASPHCERRAFTREASRSRLEHSPRQRAASEGVVVPKEGCPTARRFFRHRVRAVRSFWRDELDGLAGRPCHSEQRSENYTHRLVPFPGCGHTFCDRSRPQARPMATPSSRCCKDPSIGVGDHPELYDPTSYEARC